MVTQGVLPFRYECEPTGSGMTALAGLPPYLELATVSGLTDSIRRHLRVCSGQKQGWTDAQIVLPLVLLNVVGGDCVDDLHLRTLGRVNEDFLRFVQRKSPQREATLDQDASLIATYKAEALYNYQGDKSYQPMTTYWAEQDIVAHSEFRDGNVPANYQNLWALKETLAALPEGVVKVYFRCDTAANQKDLLRYCAEGKSERFGVIEFAIGVDVTAEFKHTAAEVAEGEWQPLETQPKSPKSAGF